MATVARPNSIQDFYGSVEMWNAAMKVCLHMKPVQ